MDTHPLTAIVVPAVTVMGEFSFFCNFYVRADTGFPVGGATNPLGQGAPTYKFAGFSPKLHEIKKILVRAGGGALNPPMYFRRFHLLTQYFFFHFHFFCI